MSSREAGQPFQATHRSHFTDYLSSRSLPANGASVRRIGDLTVALVEHAPNAGIWFDPIDDIVISRRPCSMPEQASRIATAWISYKKRDLRNMPTESRAARRQSADGRASGGMRSSGSSNDGAAKGDAVPNVTAGFGLVSTDRRNTSGRA